MRLITGLGNPGKEYEKTRHNIGFMALDRIAQRYNLSGSKGRFHSAVIEALIAGEKCLLQKPLTYMNKSGLAVCDAVNFYKLKPEQILVIVDDIALPTGALRLRSEGGAGGHNGLKDIQRVLSTKQYPRLRIGIDAPGKSNQVDYVLGKFSRSEFQKIDLALDSAADAVELWLKETIDEAMNKVN